MRADVESALPLYICKASQNLYGSTYQGAGQSQLGLIFRFSVTGEFEVLHRFNDDFSEGGYVMSPMIEGRAGTFFGTTIGTPGNTDHLQDGRARDGVSLGSSSQIRRLSLS